MSSEKLFTTPEEILAAYEASELTPIYGSFFRLRNNSEPCGCGLSALFLKKKKCSIDELASIFKIDSETRFYDELRIVLGDVTDAQFDAFYHGFDYLVAYEADHPNHKYYKLGEDTRHLVERRYGKLEFRF